MQWKENLYYFDGCHVLFGNLYQPYQTDQATVVTNVGNTGLAATATIDGIEYDNFQQVVIEGTVKPGSMTVNPDYQQIVYDEAGNIRFGEDGTTPLTEVRIDGTHYVFADGGNGCIADFQTDSKDLAHFYPGIDLTKWQTILTKSGKFAALRSCLLKRCCG